MFSTGKLLNSRVPNALASSASVRDEIWSQVATLQRLIGARSTSSASPVTACDQQRRPTTRTSTTTTTTRSYSGLASARDASSHGGRSAACRQQQVRLTSTTAPAAASGIPVSTGSTSSGSPATVSTSPLSSSAASLTTTGTHVHSRRDASTQAKHQPEADVLGRDDEFRSADLLIQPTDKLEQKPSVDEPLPFGKIYTDHMFQVAWDQERGWHQPQISKLGPIEIHPGAKSLHYAVEAFEGAKAYRGHDNKIRFFRLDQNVKRLLRSTRRLALPEFNEIEFMKCIHKLVQLDQDWIPQSMAGFQQLTSLYIRPTHVSTDPTLGVARSKSSLLYVLLSPVGPYFKTGFKPVCLYADPRYVRAWPGGAGDSKLAANYAPTIKPQGEAEDMGHSQVLWLFGDDLKLTEVGTMNIFVSVKSRETGKIHLITPPLTDGLVLPGITRDSIISLARQWPDVVVEERYLTIAELQQLIHEKRLVEMFGSGTACIVCPVRQIVVRGGTKLQIPCTDITQEHESGQLFLTKRILEAITDIQYGRRPHPWAQELIYS